MAERAADRANWSVGKQVLDFGMSQGISLEDAPDAETLQARFEEITKRWSSLPLEKRLALSPRPEDPAPDPKRPGEKWRWSGSTTRSWRCC